MEWNEIKRKKTAIQPAFSPHHLRSANCYYYYFYYYYYYYYYLLFSNFQHYLTTNTTNKHTQKKKHKTQSKGWVRSSKVQSDSETSSSDEVEHNSATEISTDSEFDHDEFIRETPKILIDDTHLRKPTKVHVKSTMILPTTGQKIHNITMNAGTNKNNNGNVILYNSQQQQKNHHAHHNHHNHHHHHTHHSQRPPDGKHQREPQFKPLIQVDPSLLSTNRVALQNPRQGDYLLNKTASTEGIASKKSLELKKRYLLGEQGLGHKIQKSDSTSVLDSKFRSFHSNISECQKLLNPASEISPGMKTFLDRTKLGENGSGGSGAVSITTISDNTSVIPLAISNLNKKVEISIKKVLTDPVDCQEKENVFVNSQNELNKGMEYSETINTTLVDAMNKREHPSPIIETIDLITPEKSVPIIDLGEMKIPSKMLESNREFMKNMQTSSDTDLTTKSIATERKILLPADSNKIIDLTQDSPVKITQTVADELLVIAKPDVSMDVKEVIPDIIEHIEDVSKADKLTLSSPSDDQEKLLSDNDEKRDSPEKEKIYDKEDVLHETSIRVPTIPWNNRKKQRNESESSSSTDSSGSACSSSTNASSSSIEDIQHYILDSTTSPDTQTNHLVPRLEVHDSSGTLMQIDSLMIIDGKYIGDPEDLKLMEIPKGMIVPEISTEKSSEEDKTATPEPAPQHRTEINSSLPSKTDQVMPVKPDLKFDTKNENKVDTLKNLPLIVDKADDHSKVVKPMTLNIKRDQKCTTNVSSPIAIDNDKTPTAEPISKGSDSETEVTGQVLTETELSDWTADDCISENFIDMEFVLNSNKGTIKRNKKAKRKSQSSTSSSAKLPTSKTTTNRPVGGMQCEGILKNLDIEEIEFMDTGSEGSCAESYSATNPVLLRNRGYVDNNRSASQNASTYLYQHYRAATTSSSPSSPYRHSHSYAPQSNFYRNHTPVREALVDDDCTLKNAEQDLRTPVNETPLPSKGLLLSATVEDDLKSQNSTNSELSFCSGGIQKTSATDLDDDSLCALTNNSQGGVTASTNGVTNATTTTTTTTEESEALTVVTSPLDSSSPKTQEKSNLTTRGGDTTPSSSEKNPQTITATSGTTSSTTSKSSTRKSSHDEGNPPSGGGTAPSIAQHKTTRKETDEISYEDYVRKLQQKITQISNARDSIDIRKQKRKSLKGETTSDTSSVIENNAAGTNLSIFTDTKSDDRQPRPQNITTNALCNNIGSNTIHKVPEIPTLTRKLEEITKERTKQKDLIHDLVMDKLQSKKLLNAEKRLTRSRNRSLFSSSASRLPSSSGSTGFNSPQKATLVNGASCTNSPHYHQASSVDRVEFDAIRNNQYKKSLSPKESNDVIQMFSKPELTSNLKSNKQRPLSESLDSNLVDNEIKKLSKTQSFTSCSSSNNRNKNDVRNNAVFAAASARVGRISRQNSDDTTTPFTASSTEKLRTEARARARLKSNHDLGLSPEEKLQALRKRYHLEAQHSKSAIARVDQELKKSESLQPSADVSDLVCARERKMVSSKSVNDISGSQLNRLHSEEISNSKMTHGEMLNAADFTSDPNLSQASTAPAQQSTANKTSRRHKDSERRKSIIQTFSSFFQKSGGKSKDGTTNTNTNTSTTANSAQPENPGTSSCTNAIPTAGEGVFSRFRISPKSKEKSKDKDGLAISGRSTSLPKHNQIEQPQYHHSNQHQHHQHSQSHSNHNHHNNHHHHHLHNHHNNFNHRQHDRNDNPERSNSQDCIAKNQIYKMSSQSSASSPQLFKLNTEEPMPPPIPPLPLNYQRSDDESFANESREQKKQRAISKAVRQAELKRLRIAQEIQREQEEIEVQLKELEARGVFIEKALRGEGQNLENVDANNICAVSDEKLLKELLEIWRNITQLKKRDEELGIRQQELQLEHRHAQLKEELNIRLSSSKFEKSSADIAAEGAILNEMLEIVAKRAALRPTTNVTGASGATGTAETTNDTHAIVQPTPKGADAILAGPANENDGVGVQLKGRQPNRVNESDI